MQQIKAILFFYLLLLICLCISAFGVHFYNTSLSIKYISIVLTFTPIIAIITIFLQYFKAKK